MPPPSHDTGDSSQHLHVKYEEPPLITQSTEAVSDPQGTAGDDERAQTDLDARELREQAAIEKEIRDVEAASAYPANEKHKHTKASILKELEERLTAIVIHATEVSNTKNPERPEQHSQSLWPPCAIDESKVSFRRYINGVQVLFPYAQPYGPQLALMSKIIQACKTGKNVYVESPTGTGKTASLACATLAWQRHNDLKGWADHEGIAKRIIYCTRTHSQAAQLAQELRKLPYRPTMTTLGSRKVLCNNSSAHEDANKSLNAKCSSLVRGKRCSKFRNLTNTEYLSRMPPRLMPQLVKGYTFRDSFAAANNPSDPGGVIDIEEIVNVASSLEACSYYTSNTLFKTAQFSVCPYNYVIEPSICSQMFDDKFRSDDCVLVLDEAHNVESLCLSVGTCNLTLFDLYSMVEHLCVLNSNKKWVATINEESVFVHKLAGPLMTFLDKLVRWIQGKRDKFLKYRAAHELKRFGKNKFHQSASVAILGGAVSENHHFTELKQEIGVLARQVYGMGSSQAPDPTTQLPPAHPPSNTEVPPRAHKRTKMEQVHQNVKQEDGPSSDDLPTDSNIPTTNAAIDLEADPERASTTEAQEQEALEQLKAELGAKVDEYHSRSSVNAFFLETGLTKNQLGRLALDSQALHKVVEESDNWRYNLGAEHNNRPRNFSNAIGNVVELLIAVQLMEEFPFEYYIGINGRLNKQLLKRPFHHPAAFNTVSSNGSIHMQGECCRSKRGAHRHGDYLGDEGDEPDENEWVFDFGIWLMDPSVVFNKLARRFYAVLLTSGTLHPSQPDALGTVFRDRLAGNLMLGHVIDSDHLFVTDVPRDAAGHELNGTTSAMRKLREGEYEERIGRVLLRMYRDGLPKRGGSLMFVPSFSKLRQFKYHWKKSGLLTELVKLRGRVLFEPTASDSEDETYDDVIRDFQTLCKTSCGPLLVAVFRGKMSEGIDFADEYCRSIFCVSVPYPQIGAYIKAKQTWNTTRAKTDETQVSGHVWYQQQAFRALNQAMGRCIRHKFDYGSIFLLDSRYDPTSNENNLLQYLPQWIRQKFRTYPSGSLAEKTIDVKRFFRKVQTLEKERLERIQSTAISSQSSTPSTRTPPSQSSVVSIPPPIMVSQDPGFDSDGSGVSV